MDFIKLCGFSEDQKWKLVYRASENGFDFDDFHDKCAGHNNCLTVTKSTNGNVFGGYTDAAWNKLFGWIRNENAFLFSLINKDNNPLKMECLKPQFAVCGHSDPWIQQYGLDLYLCSNSNVNTRSSTNLGYAYKHTSYDWGSTQAKEKKI